MYIDFEDDRPDTPRVASVVSAREGVLLSIIAHLAVFILILLFPNILTWTPAAATVQPLVQPNQQLQFVDIQPLVERPAPPKFTPDLSDLDRRSKTVVPVPKPENTTPKSVGNTPEKIVGGPKEEARAAPADPSPSLMGRNESNAPIAAARPPGSFLNDALQNLERSPRDQNFDNPRGGATEQGPDIQFDSKGVDFGSWLRRFKAQVYNNWLIPSAAMVMHGHVVIQMTIHRGGAITDIHIVSSSGIAAFDRAAVNALSSSNPTIPIPAAYPLDEISPFTVTFFYNERIP